MVDVKRRGFLFGAAATGLILAAPTIIGIDGRMKFSVAPDFETALLRYRAYNRYAAGFENWSEAWDSGPARSLISAMARIENHRKEPSPVAKPPRRLLTNAEEIENYMRRKALRDART